MACRSRLSLAAARLDTLSVPQIIDRHHEYLDLLVNDTPGHVDRHHTLRAAVSWSWSLLSEEERYATAACAVFVGGFTDELVLALWKRLHIATGSLYLLRDLREKSFFFSRIRLHRSRHDCCIKQSNIMRLIICLNSGGTTRCDVPMPRSWLRLESPRTTVVIRVNLWRSLDNLAAASDAVGFMNLHVRVIWLSQPAY